MTSAIDVRLKPGRERPVVHGHPWIFSGAIASVAGNPVSGDSVNILSHDGEWLARGLINPDAALSIRVYTRDENRQLDAAFFAELVERAVRNRAKLFPEEGPTNAYRLIYSESDGISGLIVDRYSYALAVRVGSSSLLPFLEGILGKLSGLGGISNIHVAAEEDAVARDGFDPSLLPPKYRAALPRVRIRENGHEFEVDIGEGQKTGYFLDQRMNRVRVASYAGGMSVLSAYCYTGAFEVHAAAAGAASIVALDRSEDAIVRAREHHRMNNTAVPVEYLRADVGEQLRRFRDAGRTFDMIILDPPKFVASRAQLEKGLRAYKDINLLAMKMLSPGGILATFSCSGQVSADDFRKAVAWASVDAGKDVVILETLGQPADHPILMTFKESEYLKGLICRVG
jgi:23S rRNA (cytosine1962-C5)-methyltransferase